MTLNRFFAPLRVFIFGIWIFLSLGFCRLRFLFLLSFRGKDHDHALAFHVGRLIDFCEIGQSFGQPLQHFLALLLVGNLSSLEDHCCFDFMALAKEPHSVPRLEVEVMNVCVRMEPEFFEQRDMLVFLLNLVLLGELVLEFAEVDDLADRGCCPGHNLNEVGVTLTCQGNGCPGRHDPQLASMLVDNPDFRSFDFVVDSVLLFLADGVTSYMVMDLSATALEILPQNSPTLIAPRSPFLC